MGRTQLEALAWRWGVNKPENYDIPNLKKVLKKHYREQKEREEKRCG